MVMICSCMGTMYKLEGVFAFAGHSREKYFNGYSCHLAYVIVGFFLLLLLLLGFYFLKE